MSTQRAFDSIYLGDQTLKTGVFECSRIQFGEFFINQDINVAIKPGFVVGFFGVGVAF